MDDGSGIQPPFEVQKPERYAFIINPRSGNGRAWRHWQAIEPEIASLVENFEVFQTERPEHAIDLTRQALRNGFDRIVSAGGDGTHYEVVNGFFDGTEPVSPDASMAILPIGTASDLRKTFCVPRGRDAIPFLISDKVVRVDVGRLRSTGENGEAILRHFNTAVHIGLGGIVGEHTNKRSKALGGFLTFLIGVITARIAYTEQEMTVEIDGEIFTDTLLEVVAANGFYDGGGMHVAPHGFLNSGALEVYAIGKLGPIDSLLNIPRMYRGTHDQHPAVRYARATRIHVTSKNRVVVSPDGELAGVLPATVEVVPQALRIVTGPDPRVLAPGEEPPVR